MAHSATQLAPPLIETPGTNRQAEAAESVETTPATDPETSPSAPTGQEALPGTDPLEVRHRWRDRLLGWLEMRRIGPRAPLPVLQAELEEHLNNAEAALERKRKSLAELEGKGQQLVTERQRLEQEHSRLDRDVELALAESQDRLARVALCRALALRQKLERVGNNLRSTRCACEQLAELVARQQAELVSLRQDAALALGARAEAHSEQPLDPISEEEVELELLRRKRRIAQRSSEQKEVTDAGSEL
jgi:phage shock protein A